MSTFITENGRVNGTRITVHDVYAYLAAGWSHTEIALVLGLFPDDILVAIHYIVEHKAECERVYQYVEERNARGNPPEILAKLEQTRAKMQAWREERERVKRQQSNGAGNPGGR